MDLVDRSVIPDYGEYQLALIRKNFRAQTVKAHCTDMAFMTEDGFVRVILVHKEKAFLMGKASLNGDFSNLEEFETAVAKELEYFADHVWVFSVATGPSDGYLPDNLLNLVKMSYPSSIRGELFTEYPMSSPANTTQYAPAVYSSKVSAEND